MPPSWSAAVSWYVHGSSVPLRDRRDAEAQAPAGLAARRLREGHGRLAGGESAADIAGTDRPNIVARWMKPARSHSPAKRSSTTAFWGPVPGAPRLEAPAGLSIHALFPPSGGRCEVRRAMVRRSWPARQPHGPSERYRSRRRIVKCASRHCRRTVGDAERSYTFVRHASTVYNGLGLLNGDPRFPVPLDAPGPGRGRRARPQFARLPLDLALHTRFARTRETLALLLGRRRACASRSSRPSTTSTSASSRAGRRSAYRAGARSTGPPQAVPGRREPPGGARALRRRLRAPARPARRRPRPARRARRADPLPAQRPAAGRPARRPRPHRREPRAPDRRRGADRAPRSRSCGAGSAAFRRSDRSAQRPQ